MASAWKRKGEKLMAKRVWCTVAAMAWLLLTGPGFAQEPFFKGKVIRIIVGFSPGGGFDTYSRFIARHMGKHIPGNPTVIVENMPGAGSLIAANHIFKVAKPDGLTIGNWNGGLVLGQLFGLPGIEFDARKFQWIGSPLNLSSIIGLSKATGITTMRQWMASKKPVQIGMTAPGSNLYDVPKILHAAIGLPMNFVLGYKGFDEIRLAIEAGEVDGAAPAWPSARATWSRALESGEVVIVVQTGTKPSPYIPNVPLAVDFAKDEEGRQLIRAGSDSTSTINRAYSLPPATPIERVQLLRKAFQSTMKDPELISQAKKSKLDLEPISGEEVEAVVADLFKLSPGVVAKLKEALK
jgi:tripartite-type tricarboxylate transporter receptor subunit TctC